MLAVANPLRGIASDGAYGSNALDSVEDLLVLVGHSGSTAKSLSAGVRLGPSGHGRRVLDTCFSLNII